MKMRKESPQKVIEAYRKRQQMMPFIVGGLAILLVTIGIIVIVVSFFGNGELPKISLFPSNTPTPTNTYTPTPITPTITPSETPTITLTPTETITPTLSGPIEYTIQEGDTCWDIAAKYNIDIMVMLALNNFGNACPIKVGDKIKVPSPNMKLPTATPIPNNLPWGTKVDYTVAPGDTLDKIAALLNSTIEEIKKENKITDANMLYAGQILKVPVNLVTRTPTFAPTSTQSSGQVAPTHSGNLQPVITSQPQANPAPTQGQTPETQPQ